MRRAAPGARTGARLVAAALAVLIGALADARADGAPAGVAASLAPTGRLRVAINFGNPVLAQKDPASGAPRGVSAELAQALAERLGVTPDFIAYDAAGKVFDALASGAWDLAFLAIDPVRAAGIDFSAPYVVIEGVYLVPANSSIGAVDDLDRDGIRVAVGRGSAYDLYLTRALKHAQLVRAPSSAESLELFLRDKLEAAAGVKQPVVGFAAAHPGTRVVPGRFMVIEQAMGIPKGRDAGLRYLRRFVEDMKANGLVAAALARSNQPDATVAPPAPVD